MALIQFKVTAGRQRCMQILLGTTWGMISANPFSVDSLAAPGTIMPVVVLFVCLLAWATFASTRLCQHSVGTAATIVWTLNCYTVIHLVVYGFAPAFGLAALFVAPFRTVTSPRATLTKTTICVVAVLIAAASILIADPWHLMTPGGYRSFDALIGNQFERVLVYVAAVVLAVGTRVFPPKTNPVQTLAYSSSLVLVCTTILGFMASMTVLDSSGSLANVDFYHCCFLLAWSALMFAVLSLLCAFHVIGLAFDAFATLGFTSFTVVVMQWILKHQPPHLEQIIGIVLLAFAMMMFNWMELQDETADRLIGVHFFTCQECCQERNKETAVALNVAGEF
jgi:hypothetical protein